MTPLWDESNEQWLRDLWYEVPQIPTKEIGRRMGFSKNSIVGKARRLGLTGRESPIRHGGQPAPAQPRAGRQTLPPLRSDDAQPAPRLKVVAPPPPPPPPPKMPRARECCWPLGEPGSKGFRFCDSPDVVGGTPYCADHCKLAYTKSPASAERPAYIGSKLPISAVSGGPSVRRFAD